MTADSWKNAYCRYTSNIGVLLLNKALLTNYGFKYVHKTCLSALHWGLAMRFRIQQSSLDEIGAYPTRIKQLVRQQKSHAPIFPLNKPQFCFELFSAVSIHPKVVAHLMTSRKPLLQVSCVSDPLSYDLMLFVLICDFPVKCGEAHVREDQASIHEMLAAGFCFLSDRGAWQHLASLHPCLLQPGALPSLTASQSRGSHGSIRLLGKRERENRECTKFQE